jgi:hypothetical protein
MAKKQNTQKSTEKNVEINVDVVATVTAKCNDEADNTVYVDEYEYNKYTALKFLDLSGASLTDDAKKELAHLEAEVKKCGGALPSKTVNAYIGSENLKMVAGVPMPKRYHKIIGAATTAVQKYYIA